VPTGVNPNLTVDQNTLFREITVKRENLAGSFSLPMSTCGSARTDRNIADKSKERARGTGQVPVLAIEYVNWNGCLQM